MYYMYLAVPVSDLKLLLYIKWTSNTNTKVCTQTSQTNLKDGNDRVWKAKVELK